MTAIKDDPPPTPLESKALPDALGKLQARTRAEEELLQTMEAVRQSHERLTAALAAAEIGTFRWDLATQRVEADVNLERLLGLEPGTVRSLEDFTVTVHPDDRRTVSELYSRCAQDGSNIDLEFRVVWRDGSIHWISQKGKTFAGPGGRPLYVSGACTDVTGHRSTDASHENAEQLRAIFSHAAVGIALVRLDGRFLEVNQKFSDLLGYSMAELKERTFRDVTHSEDLKASAATADKLLLEGRSEHAFEKRYLRKDGSEIWSLTTVALLRDSQGRPHQFLTVIEDITPRKRAEAALREESRILELLHETGRILASNLELQAVVQSVTDAATQLSGAKFGAFFYNVQDENGEAFLLYTLSGAPREAFERFGKPRATALFGPTFRGEAPIRCDDVLQDPRYGKHAPHHGMPNGHLPVRSYLAVPVFSRTGETLGGLFFGHPEPGVFSERSERLVVGIAAQAGIAIDNARLYEAAQKAARERQALLESERAARAAAEKLSDLKDEFLATLSHELRTPLSAILGWSQLLQRTAKSPPDYAKGLEAIERNARLQTQLIEDLLDMSRVTSGKLRLDVQPLLPISFIQAALETVGPSTEAKGIRVETSLAPDAGPITGDPGRLQQVLWNILSNAIKFTPRDGKIQVVLAQTDSHVEITVTDTGIGIDPQFIGHIFERFRQADASTTRRYGGLGLGLSIVKSLVELHGGTVSVRSPGVGLGTTVTVQLPLSSELRSEPPQQLSSPRSGDVRAHEVVTADLKGIRALVVDDHSDARDLIRRLLEECSAEVFTAGSASEALPLIQAQKPNVLITDIGMPDMDGFELIKRIRALGPECGGSLPAIALTAFARQEDRTRALHAGFLLHVAKPVDPSELIAAVASVTGRIASSSGF